jgi:hypothetical protein
LAFLKGELMKPRKCPKDGTEIKKYWPNPINKNMLVGRCPTCGKLVNLGPPDGSGSEQRKPAGDGKPAAKAKVQEKGKAKESRGAAVPIIPVERAPSSDRVGRTFATKLRSFFEID